MRNVFTLFFIPVFLSLNTAVRSLLVKMRIKCSRLRKVGLQGVSVSDGLHVMKTNVDGDLPGYARTRFVFITVPAGYKISDNHYLYDLYYLSSVRKIVPLRLNNYLFFF